MKVLFDHNVPKKLRSLLPGHSVLTSRELGWDEFKNGDLLAAAEAKGFEVLVTGDKNMRYQQNLQGRKLALVILPITNWKALRLHPASIVAAVDRSIPGSFEQLEWSRE